jgi:hypothetical protein
MAAFAACAVIWASENAFIQHSLAQISNGVSP